MCTRHMHAHMYTHRCACEKHTYTTYTHVHVHTHHTACTHPTPTRPLTHTLYTYITSSHTHTHRRMDSTALYLAAQEDNACICQLLLKAGADPSWQGAPRRLHSPAYCSSQVYCCGSLQIHSVVWYTEIYCGILKRTVVY